MKGRLAIFLTVALMVVVLAALNAASYVRVETAGDTEFDPDRSTNNSGGTGTRALYEYLRQSGRDVARWRRPASELRAEGEARARAASDSEGVGASPATFVVVGRLRRGFARNESEALLRWVAAGGRLVVVDRSPDPALLPTSGRWRVGSELVDTPDPGVRADDAEEMTRGVELVEPSQPTALTRDVSGVARSRFAARLHVYRIDAPAALDYKKPGGGGPRVGDTNANANSNTNSDADAPSPTPTPDEEDFWGDEDEGQTSPPPPKPAPEASDKGEESEASENSEEEDSENSEEEDSGESESPAPVSHLGDGRKGSGSMLIDYAYGRGRVVVLSDPYVFSNAGLNRADNLFLAVNVVTGGRARGLIGFDEFHHGYGEGQNETLAYFRGTPVLWLFAQGALVCLALVWTRGRRFARALPAPHEDRRSKLEFVASMAELQQRARAYDLALENVYTRTRRALARYGGLSANSSPEEIAERVAARSGRGRAALESLLRECEDACAGVPLDARRALELARQLRELERELGILMRSREIRQVESK